MKNNNQHLAAAGTAWCVHHWSALCYAKRQLTKTPLATVMTLLVIAIALALPSGLFILLNNMEKLSDHWDHQAEISLFLTMDTSDKQAQALQVDLKKRPDIADVRYVSPVEGLKLFEKTAGFGNVLEQLGSNPLPGVLEVLPEQSQNVPASLQALLSNLQSLPQVESAKLDMQWLQRFNAVIDLLQSLVSGLALFFILAVLLIIGNTLRLAMENYRADIEVLKLIGGTDRYIRRPFLYTGALYGMLGACIALLIVRIALASLQAPVDSLAHLYQSQFSLVGFDGGTGLLLVLSGAVLGYFGAKLAISGHLKAIEPE